MCRSCSTRAMAKGSTPADIERAGVVALLRKPIEPAGAAGDAAEIPGRVKRGARYRNSFVRHIRIGIALSATAHTASGRKASAGTPLKSHAAPLITATTTAPP